ncbi:hypothetical protein BDZ97DRAFT_1998317, partial [Flammula alnicola]
MGIGDRLSIHRHTRNISSHMNIGYGTTIFKGLNHLLSTERLAKVTSPFYLQIRKRKSKMRSEEFIDQDPDNVWIDESKGIFAYPYKADVVLEHKK